MNLGKLIGDDLCFSKRQQCLQGEGRHFEQIICIEFFA